MTYHHHYNLPNELLEQIASEGLDALPELLRIIINTAMLAERQQYLGVGPFQRSPARTDQANGFKPKTVNTRIGEVTFAIPQVRNGDFYPGGPGKGTTQRARPEPSTSRDVCARGQYTQSDRHCREAVRHERIQRACQSRSSRTGPGAGGLAQSGAG